MANNAFINLFKRDFKQLADEIKSYNDEEYIWIVKAKINNSAGNFAMHFAGNLQHFIGNVLGNTAYIRDRQYELNCKGLSSSKIIETINNAENDVLSTLNKLSLSD